MKKINKDLLFVCVLGCIALVSSIYAEVVMYEGDKLVAQLDTVVNRPFYQFAAADSSAAADGLTPPSADAATSPFRGGTEEDYIAKRQDEFVFYDVPLDRQQQIYVQTVCRRYDIPYEIVLGIMNTESGFDASAKNGNCYGIMQVHTISKKQYAEEFEELGIYNLNSFYNGVEAGCFLFSKCKGENIEQRLIAYNEGQTAAAQLFKKGVTSTEYSKKVLEYAKRTELSLS